MPKLILKYLKHVRAIATLLIIGQQCMLSSADAQDNVNGVSVVFDKYHQSAVKEKLFVHTDKTFYLAGELAWFKVYVVDAFNHKPLDLSKVAYVEILDSTSKPVLQAKIALDKAEGKGSFYLPLTLNSGNYKLRAYTNWLKNYGAAWFFEKDITIINVQKTINSTASKEENKVDIQFFPEGGNLVNNLPAKVAFKATDQHGKGITFSGILLDNGDTLLKFNPRHAGIGSFSFTPHTDHTYRAIIKMPGSETVLKDIAPVYKSGYVMTLTDSADQLRVLVTSDILYQQDIYLFAHTREIIKASLSSSLQDGKAVFMVNKGMLGDGISHLTIFNNSKKPVCERLYFKKPAKQLVVDLSANQPLYAPRKKATISIKARDIDIQNDSASLSMTVYRVDSLQRFNGPAINSYLLLTSDLKGFVEDPDYYFSKDDAETAAALDNVMLTNGWRRFKWEDVLTNQKTFFKYVPEFNGHIVTGSVLNLATNTPAADIETFISVPGFQPAFTSSVSNREGQLRFELKNNYGSPGVIVQANKPGDTKYRIDLADPFSNEYSGVPYPLFNVQQNNAGSLLEQSISMQVQNIYSGKNLKHFLTPVIDSTPFYITADAKYALDDYTRFTTLEEVLREYVTLTDVKKREGRFHFNVYDNANSQMFKSDPLVLLDGVPMLDFDKFMRVDPLKLKRLEVLNRKYFLGNSSFDGILNWTSYNGDLAEYQPGEQATIIDYEGLQEEREFYSPVYVYDDQQSSHIPDFRNVLMWSPDIKIAANGSTNIDFYTSDLPGKYAVQVQGITSNGLSGSKILSFEVQK